MPSARYAVASKYGAPRTSVRRHSWRRISRPAAARAHTLSVAYAAWKAIFPTRRIERPSATPCGVFISAPSRPPNCSINLYVRERIENHAGSGLELLVMSSNSEPSVLGSLAGGPWGFLTAGPLSAWASGAAVFSASVGLPHPPLCWHLHGGGGAAQRVGHGRGRGGVARRTWRCIP